MACAARSTRSSSSVHGLPLSLFRFAEEEEEDEDEDEDERGDSNVEDNREMQRSGGGSLSTTTMSASG